MPILTTATPMLTEFPPRPAPSGVALDSFGRNLGTFLGGVVSQLVLAAIGNSWLFSGQGSWRWQVWAVGGGHGCGVGVMRGRSWVGHVMNFCFGVEWHVREAVCRRYGW
jgi:hypothetical protein